MRGGGVGIWRLGELVWLKKKGVREDKGYERIRDAGVLT
jgi:hypothetical protein